MGIFGSGLKGGQGFYLGYQSSPTPQFSDPMATTMLAKQYAGRGMMDGLGLKEPKGVGLNQQTIESRELYVGLNQQLSNVGSQLETVLKEYGGDLKKAQEDERWSNAMGNLQELNSMAGAYKTGTDLLKSNKMSQVKYKEEVSQKKAQDSYVLDEENKMRFLYNTPEGGIKFGVQGQEEAIMEQGGQLLIQDANGLRPFQGEENPYLTYGQYINAQEALPLIEKTENGYKPVVPQVITPYKAGTFTTALENYINGAASAFRGSSAGGFGMQKGGIAGDVDGISEGQSYLVSYKNSGRSNNAALNAAADWFVTSLNAEESKDLYNEYYKYKNTTESKGSMQDFISGKLAAEIEPRRAVDTSSSVSFGGQVGGSGGTFSKEEALSTTVSNAQKIVEDMGIKKNVKIHTKNRREGFAGSQISNLDVTVGNNSRQNVNLWNSMITKEKVEKDGVNFEQSKTSITEFVPEGGTIFIGTESNLMEINVWENTIKYKGKTVPLDYKLGDGIFVENFNARGMSIPDPTRKYINKQEGYEQYSSNYYTAANVRFAEDALYALTEHGLGLEGVQMAGKGRKYIEGTLRNSFGVNPDDYQQEVWIGLNPTALDNLNKAEGTIAKETGAFHTGMELEQ